MSWILTACGSALFAGLVSILAKLGIKSTDSDVATAIRTGVVQIDKMSLLVSVAFAYLAFGEKLTRKSGCGLALLVLGTAVMTAFA